MNVCRPPNGNVDCFIEELAQITEILCNGRYKDIFLLWDVNIDHYATKRTKATASLEAMLLSLGLTQHIKCPTRVTIKTESLIDVVYIRTNKFIYPFTKPMFVSDHYLIGAVRYLNYTSSKKTKFTGRTYRNYNFELAKSYYARVNRDLIYTIHDLDLIWETLFRIISNCANVLCPIRTLRVKPNRLPWLITEITEIIHDRDDLFLEAYANNDMNLLAEAKSLKTKVSKAIRNAKRFISKISLGEISLQTLLMSIFQRLGPD